MKKNKKLMWLVLAGMGLSALVSGFVAPQGIYGAFGLLAWTTLCCWNVYAYFNEKWMSALWAAASLPKDVEPERRTFTFYVTAIGYFLFLGIYVWQYYR